MEAKHYPKPEYCKCNKGHTLVEIYNEKTNSFYWDCPICIKLMQIAEEAKHCQICGGRPLLHARLCIPKAAEIERKAICDLKKKWFF